MIGKQVGTLMAALALSCGVAQAQTFPGDYAEGPPVGDPVATPTSAPADKPDPWRLFPEFGGVQIFGWVNGGYVYNASAGGAGFNGPYNSIDRNDPMFNQAYLVAERALRGEDISLGGRIDFIYGYDFLLAQSRGWELTRDAQNKWNNNSFDYGLAIPQLYGEIGTETASVKIGHFYSIVGYEGLPAINNFFYSHSYSYQFAGPFTHWGALGLYKVNDNLTVQAGLVNGWNAVDRLNNQVNFLGGARWTDKLFWASFAIVAGGGSPDAPALGGAQTSGTEMRYSAIVGLTPVEGVEYVFHHWYGLAADYTPTGQTGLWYGIDQYLYYTLDKQWRVGGRFEWFRDEDGTRVGLNRPANPNKRPFPGNFYSATAGVNWTPNDNVRLRPEIRWDWYDGNANPRPFNGKDNQFMLACDLIIQF